jgi:hypothetical protein
MRGRGIRVGVAVTIAAFSLAMIASPAFAHADIVSGTTGCGSSSGTSYEIIWSVANDWNLPETVEATATSGAATLSDTSFEIPASGNGFGGAGQLPYESVIVVQSLPDSVTGPISLTVAGRYQDGYTTSNSGEVAAPTNCARTAPTPTVPTTLPVVPSTSATPAPVGASPPPTTAPPASSVPSPPAPKVKKVARSKKGLKRPTLLANSLPNAKPTAPISKAAAFTG